MGYRYVGGGMIAGVPAEDLFSKDFAALPAEAQHLVARSEYYTPAPDDTLERVKVLDQPKYKRILVVCPKYRFESETRDAIHAQVWSGSIDWFFTKDNPYPQTEHFGYRNIAYNMNRARRVFLAGDYDAMFVVESDIIPPLNALDMLSRVDADVAGGLYVMRGAAHSTNALQYDPTDPSLRHPLPLSLLRGRRVVRTNGNSMGCNLIARWVLKRQAFRFVQPSPPDTWFMKDCNEMCAVSAVDVGVVCGHKDADGKIYWPDL